MELQWISVDERLPEVGEWANLLTDTASPFEDGSFFRMFNDGKDKVEVTCGFLAYCDEPEDDGIGWGYWCKAWTPSGCMLNQVYYVTHWMPLPSPPEAT